MNGMLEERQEALAEICRRFRVRRLELFGSAAGDAFRPEASDIDFLVEFLPLEQGEFADAYFGLLDALEGLFARRVDLVMAGAVHNSYFLESIEPTRRAVYAS